MSVRVRFAPSPTGYLHIGGARTAMYSYLFAKAMGGKFVLRVEDTDLSRSKREYEVSQVNDLSWLGIEFDESPENPGEFGPYRQSERFDIYKKYAWELVEKGMAYPCFLTSDELETLTAKAESEKIAPHAYHGKYRDMPAAESKVKIDAGEEYIIRFKNPGKKWSFKDIVRGEVKFPEDMVGDFVILRSSGLPVYNFCCVIDDHLMKISHVIRAEEHLNNTVRQLMIYEGIGAEVPTFAHVSLLVGEDRQKLSKRHGATSVSQYREQNYLPEALMNYLCLLGWSHPEEKDIFDINELGSVFDMKRFSKSPALYDIKKLNFFNEQYLRSLSTQDLVKGLINELGEDSPVNKMDEEWQNNFAELYREKIQLFSDIKDKASDVFEVIKDDNDDYKAMIALESTIQIKDHIQNEILKLKSSDVSSISADLFSQWMKYFKSELKIKGKPLFMGMRVVLTGMTHGPDLKALIPLTPLNIIEERINKFF